MSDNTPGWSSSEEICRLLPKIEPLRGSLHPDWKTCGKPSCRCARGEWHGPYWSHRWRGGGRRRRRSVKAAALARFRAGLAKWRRLHPPARSTREALAGLRSLMREFDDRRI